MEAGNDAASAIQLMSLLHVEVDLGSCVLRFFLSLLQVFEGGNHRNYGLGHEAEAVFV